MNDKINNLDKSKVFDSGLACIEKCPFDKDIDFEVSREVGDKLEYLQSQFKDVEFLVYGNAEKTEKENKYVLKEIIIPKQKVGTISVDNIKPEDNYNTVLHKHPGDNPYGFSLDDDRYINNNHQFSLLIGSKDLYKIIGVASIKTDCGRYFKCKMNITLGNRNIDDKNFLESISNIQAKDKSFIDKVVAKLWGSPHKDKKI